MEEENNLKTFDELYEEKIVPLIDPYEKNRIKQLYLTLFYLIVMNTAFISAITWIVYVSISTSTGGAGQLVAMLILVMIIFSFSIWYSAKNKIVEKAKINILQPLAKLIENFSWTDKLIISKEKIQNFGFAPKAEKIVTMDAFYGAILDMPVKIQETGLYHERGSGTKSRFIFDLEGVCILLQMNKNFTGKTIVLKDKGQVLCKNMNKEIYNGMEHVSVESIEFEKEFEVYSTDQVEARYILTTAFMERLESIKKYFDANYVECGFYQNEMLIHIDTKKNMFEVGDLIHSFKNKKMYEDTYNEIISIVDMIKHLKLNIKTRL